jgi:excisionase family DNA binding protein
MNNVMKEISMIKASDSNSIETNQTILFLYSPAEYWNKIRQIIREETEKKEDRSPTPLSTEVKGMTYKPLYKVEEVCAIFSVSRQTIYQWIDQGLLKPHKVRSRVYFLSSDIESLINGQKHV